MIGPWPYYRQSCNLLWQHVYVEPSNQYNYSRCTYPAINLQERDIFSNLPFNIYFQPKIILRTARQILNTQADSKTVAFLQ